MILNLTDLSDEPLQGQIVRQIRVFILSGELKSGESLPSIRALAREQRVSVITVQRAYETLMRDGLIHSRRGKGFFVSEIAREDKEVMARERLSERLKPAIKEALAEGLPGEEIVVAVKNIIAKEQ
jgi:GntR family transcriptional regulator